MEPGSGTTEAKSVGAILRSRRERRGWKLRDLKERTGISVPYLNQIERDEVLNPAPEKLERIAEVLGADLDEVYWERDKAELVRRFDIDPQVAELVLRLRAADAGPRTELVEWATEVLDKLTNKQTRPKTAPASARRVRPKRRIAS